VLWDAWSREQTNKGQPAVPGMSTGLSTHNSTIVTAFYHELLRQGLVVAMIMMLVGVARRIPALTPATGSRTP
jgi:hypothetical protein